MAPDCTGPIYTTPIFLSVLCVAAFVSRQWRGSGTTLIWLGPSYSVLGALVCPLSCPEEQKPLLKTPE
jgi:hypothetical protein